MFEEDYEDDFEELEEEKAPLSEEDAARYFDALLADERQFVLEEAGVLLPDWRSLPEVQMSQDTRVLESWTIPLGRLFYPCSGRELQVCLSRFSGLVSEFHFVDAGAFQPQRMQGHDGRGFEFHPRVRAMLNFAVLSHPSVRPSRDTAGNRIFRATADGMTYLAQNLDSISVFYLEEDGCGEGGSCICWMGHSLFPLVLSRLLMGGLVVIGRRNNRVSDEHKFPSVRECADRLGLDWDSRLLRGKVGDEVRVGNRRLACVGTLPRENQQDLVWQLIAVDHNNWRF